MVVVCNLIVPCFGSLCTFGNRLLVGGVLHWFPLKVSLYDELKCLCVDSVTGSSAVCWFTGP